MRKAAGQRANLRLGQQYRSQGYQPTEVICPRRPAGQAVTDPTAMFEDDLRPSLYRLPRFATGSPWRVPRPSDEDDEDG